MIGKDHRFFVALVSCLFCFLIARALWVPWVHDECASLLWYAEPGVFLPPHAHADANNHILSSALGALFIRLFGLSLLVSRLGSVLAFALYAFTVWRLGARIRSRSLRWCAWPLLLFCPFLFEFFALFRGYGLELAFLAVAVNGGLRWARTFSLPAFAQLLGGVALADLSVLALVPLWALLVAFLAAVLVFRRQGFQRRALVLHSALWFVLGLLPLLWGLDLAFDLRAKGLLYHGSTTGLLPVTIGPLSNLVVGGDGPLIRWAVVLFCLFPLGTTIALNAWRRPLGIVSVFFMADVFMRIALAWCLDVNYPEDRAALHLLWLVLFAVPLALDELSTIRPRVRWLGPLLLLLPLRALLSANVDHTSLWPEQSAPERFVVRLDEMQRKAGRSLVVGAYHQMELTLPYMARHLGRTPVRPHAQGFPEGTHDVRIADERHLAAASIGFTEVDHSPGNRLHFLVRGTPLQRSLVHADSTLRMDPNDEFFRLWTGEASHDVILVEVRCSINARAGSPDLLLVASTKDAEGHDLVYDAVRPSALGRMNTGEPATYSARFESIPGAAHYALYFWNATGHPVEISGVELRVFTLR